MWEGRANTLAVPLYHAAAMYISMIMIHYWDVPAALGIGNVPLSSVSVMEYLHHAEVDAVILPPAVLEELSHDTESVEALAKLEFVGFGGGECLPSQRLLRVMVANDPRQPCQRPRGQACQQRRDTTQRHLGYRVSLALQQKSISKLTCQIYALLDLLAA